MRIVFRSGTGVAPGAEHVEPGEPIWDDTNRRLGIGNGSATPLWYPAFSPDGNLLLGASQTLGSLTHLGVVEMLATGVRLRRSAAAIVSAYGVVDAVNSIAVTNSVTGASPSVAAEGTDANVGLDLSAKGTGSVSLRTSGGVQFSVKHKANAVNYAVLSGGATGEAVELTAEGANTAIDIKLTPKGGAYVSFGGYTGTASEVVGYIQIKDAGGVLRKLAVVE